MAQYMNLAPGQDLPVGQYDISPEDAKGLMEQGGYVVVDVRSPAEFASGHIKGAVNVPLEQLLAGDNTGLPSPETPLLLYCRSGHRSGIATTVIAGQGWERVANFGGVIQWPFGLVR